MGTIAVSALVGVLIAVQSRINAELAVVLGNGAEAALISFGSGFLLLLIGSLASARMRLGLRAIAAAVRSRHLPRWQLLAGMGGATLVLIQAHLVPVIGVALFSVATIAGQSIASIVVDRMGLRSDGSHHRITTRRVLTAVISIVAVGISVGDRLQAASIPLALLALLAGAVVAVQRALNAHITDYSHHSYATTWVNFATGLALLIVVNLIWVGRLVSPPMSAGSWWLYTGGAIGVVYIALAAIVVQRIGALMAASTSVAGQLIGSVALDRLYPTAGVHLGPNMLASVLLSLVAVAVGSLRRKASAP